MEIGEAYTCGNLTKPDSFPLRNLLTIMLMTSWYDKVMGEKVAVSWSQITLNVCSSVTRKKVDFFSGGANKRLTYTVTGRSLRRRWGWGM